MHHDTPRFKQRGAPPGTPDEASMRKPSRWIVPSLAITVVVGLAAASAYALLVAYEPERLSVGQHSTLQALQAWLPGQVLHVPGVSGLWAAELRGSQLVLARARPDGPAQTVSLCTQLHGGSHDPLALYPMALVPGLPNPESDSGLRSRTARHPIVLPLSLKPGLPSIWVQGRLSGDHRPAELRLRVVPAAGGAAGNWHVSLARPQANPSGAVGQTFSLAHEAWILWSPPDGAADPVASAAALAGQSSRYRHGVRVRRIAVPGCNHGGLEWQLFSAGDNTDASKVLSRLWVLPARAEAAAPALQVELRPGHHQIPAEAAPSLEDRTLFEQALRAGLIQPLPDGRVAVSSAESSNLPMSKALHTSANGAYVLNQVRQFNQDQYWLALRIRAWPGQALPVSAEPTRWHFASDGGLADWSIGLPPVAARLRANMPEGFTPWIRVRAPAAWLQPPPAADGRMAAAPPLVHIGLPVLPPSQAVPSENRRLQILVLGRVHQVQGAQVLSSEPACDGPGCAEQDMVRLLTLEVEPGATEVTVVLADQGAFNRLNPAAAERRNVHRQGQELAWKDLPGPDGPPAQPANVVLLAQDGRPLFLHGAATDLAHELGLAPLVGLEPRHERSLAGNLARLGELGQEQAIGILTVDTAYQASLQAVLGCLAQQGGVWVESERKCRDGYRSTVPAGRISAAVLLDARGGAVLAAVSGRTLPTGLPTEELLAFDNFNPGHSPLAVPALQQVGGQTQTPGSAFKVVDALMLETLALQSGALDSILQGLPGAELEARAQSAGLTFQMASACYPSPCTSRTTQVRNYHDAPASRYADRGRMSLVQAMRHSVNTWFAVLAEMTDRTARSGNADARALGVAALRSERPLLGLAHETGLAAPLRLDAGLLPAQHRWGDADVLLGTATRFDPIEDVHNIRMQALGLRMQTTPLHMARIAAGVATGRLPAVHLLKQLNGLQAPEVAGVPLTMRLDRIREGMHEVVQAGTAAAAFAGPQLRGARAQVFGKTGTAPMATDPPGATCDPKAAEADLPAHCLNNAWFIGYLEPGALPGETRTLAVAVQVTHTRRTGGALAAAVVGSWLRDHWARHEAPLQTPIARVPGP